MRPTRPSRNSAASPERTRRPLGRVSGFGQWAGWLVALGLAVRVAVASAAGEEQLVRQAGFAPDQVAYLVADATSGRVLALARGDAPAPPASTAKLVTALAALELLGPRSRLATRLYVRGAIADGVLSGELVLEGGGDPTLDLDGLHALALALRRAGVRELRGRFLLADGLFSRRSEIAAGEPVGAAYNPGVGPLAVAFNRVRLLWRSGRPYTVPPLFEAELEAVAEPGAVVGRAERSGRTVWRLGAEARERVRALPVRDGGMQAARLLRRLAGFYGIRLPPPERGPVGAGARLIAEQRSAPVARLVRDMLWYSNNLMAEQLGLLASRRLLAHPAADAAASAEALLAHLGARIPGLVRPGTGLVDHSGLAPGSRLSVRQLGLLLRYGWRCFDLPALLPASGWSGTLRRRLDGPQEALALWAKTGSLAFVRALAGYLLDSGGRPRIVAVMVTDPLRRRAYLEAGQPPAWEEEVRDWRRRAQALEDALIRLWLGRGAPSGGDTLQSAPPAQRISTSSTLKVRSCPASG